MPARTAAGCLFFLLFIGLALSGVVTYNALSGEPGANMRLMALPLIGTPMSLVGGLLLIVVYLRGEAFTKTERTILYVIAASTLAPFALLWILG